MTSLPTINPADLPSLPLDESKALPEMLDFPVVRGSEEEHAALFNAMNHIIAVPDAIVARLRLFTDDQLMQMWGYAKEWGAKAWWLECACAFEAKRRVEKRSGRGHKGVEGRVAAMGALADEQGTNRSSVYRDAQLFDTFFVDDGEIVLAGQNNFGLLDKALYQEALRAADTPGDKEAPRRALDLICQRKDDNPFYSRRDARGDVERLRFDAKQERLAALRAQGAPDQATPLADFPVIYADPPWRYEDSTTSPNRFIENQYPTMDLDEICAMPVASWAAKDAILFLWATSPKLEEALQVMRAWGFSYRTNLVWVKDKIGLGHWVRQQHELLLIGRRGAFPTPEPARRPSSVIEAPRTVHSAKPTEMYDLIEGMYPGLRYLELFARAGRAGWASFGNEAPSGAA